MPEDARHPYSPTRLKLGWKTRTTKSKKKGPTDYGSFYAIIPKGQVQHLGWRASQDLVAQVESDRLVLTPLVPSPEHPRPSQLPAPPLNQFLCGDVLDQLAKIPSQSVHMVITSPPYNLSLPYDRYDDDREYNDYRAWLKKVWAELFRVLVRGGRFALNTAPTSIADLQPIHLDLTNDARDVKFTFRTEIIWYKQNMTAPRTAWGSFRSATHPHIIPSWEYVDILHKYDWKLPGERDRVDITPQEFVEWSDGMWLIQPEAGKPGNHPAPFPEMLVERLLKFYSFQGNVVLDPFGGTGTVAAVAARLKRDFIYIDQSKEYCELAQRRVARAGGATPLLAPRVQRKRYSRSSGSSDQ